jgi:hypothetical protein
MCQFFAMLGHPIGFFPTKNRICFSQICPAVSDGMAWLIPKLFAAHAFFPPLISFTSKGVFLCHTTVINDQPKKLTHLK